jgi:hypothetical protein
MICRPASNASPRLGQGDGHDHGDVTNLEITGTVNRRNRLDRILSNRLLDHFAQISLDTRMRRIAEIRYCAPLIFVADHAREQRDTASGRDIRNGGLHVSDRQGSLAHAQHLDNIHGWQSNRACRDGPSRTREGRHGYMPHRASLGTGHPPNRP